MSYQAGRSGTDHSDAQLLRQPHFGFVDDLFEAAEAREGKAIRGYRADFADGRIGFQRRTAAFFVYQDKHLVTLATPSSTIP